MKGRLFLVSTPIGNYGDITLRALEVLKKADILVCEENREGRRLLSQYGIDRPVRILNEHNETEETDSIFTELNGGKEVALFTDAGTPLFADPGLELVRRCLDAGIPVTSLPGANSLLPALQLSGFAFNSFVFIGWLSPKKEIRRSQLNTLKDERRLMVTLEAPYRLLPLLRDMRTAFGPDRRAAVLFDLTTEMESVYRGSLKEIAGYFERNPRKGEFVLIVAGKDTDL
jgi:16S rRNA (cytidine1402-2'-O)-methyltransferase